MQTLLTFELHWAPTVQFGGFAIKRLLGSSPPGFEPGTSCNLNKNIPLDQRASYSDQLSHNTFQQLENQSFEYLGCITLVEVQNNKGLY